MQSRMTLNFCLYFLSARIMVMSLYAWFIRLKPRTLGMLYQLSYITCSRFFVMTYIWPTSVAFINPILVTPAQEQ